MALVVRPIPLPETRPLRQSVLRPHETLDELASTEGPDTFGVGAFDDEALVAVGLIQPEGGPGLWRIRGMATLPSARGRGAGTAVLAALVAHAEANGAKRIWCNARVPAISLYERAGFDVASEVFEPPHIGPHVVMERPARGRSFARSAWLVVGAVTLLAILMRVVYGPGDFGFDAAFSLVWGDELRHLNAPDYGAAVTPTPHPLANVVAGFASLAGDAGPTLLLALSFVSFAALAVVAYEAGRRAFGVAAGVVFSAILVTRPILVAETLQASTDIPYLVFVLGALVLEFGRERRGAPVLVVLALAGLIRPDAWSLSAAYALYLLASAAYRSNRARALRVAVLAVAAPLIWAAADLVTTGSPVHSFTRTQDLAAHLERERGVVAAVRELPTAMQSILGGEVVWLGIAVGAIAVFAVQRRAQLPFALLLFGMANFVALGLGQLPLINRYLLAPGAGLALFCAGGVGAAGWLRVPKRLRFAPPALAVATVVTLASGIPTLRTDLQARIAHSSERRALYADLLVLADTARQRGLVNACKPLQTAVYRPVPVLAYRLGVAPSSIEVIRPSRARRGLMFAPTLDAVIGDVGLYPGVVVPSADLTLPTAFARVRTNDWGTIATRAC